MLDVSIQSYFVLWNPNIWDARCFTTVKLTKAPKRTALGFELRRVTARSKTDERLCVLLTKFHQGTTTSEHSSNAHYRTTTWNAMMDIVRRRNAQKWMITGSLATSFLQLVMHMNLHQRDLNPTRVFSSNGILSCVAQGIELASCANHDHQQVIVLDMGCEDSQPKIKRDECEKGAQGTDDHHQVIVSDMECEDSQPKIKMR